MPSLHIFRTYLSRIILIALLLPACTASKQWEGQAAIQKVNTESRPVQFQLTGSFPLGSGISIANDFDGARMNGALLSGDTLITVLITSENTPINESPWYAFKLWADGDRIVYLKLTYQDGVKHRYYPKLSADGITWQGIERDKYTTHITGTTSEGREFPESVTLKLDIGPDTLWVAGQEVITSRQSSKWSDDMAMQSFVSKEVIGQSLQGKDLEMLRITEAGDAKIVVVLGRLHPPEVPGYLAMQSFVETICSDTEIARAFRKEFATYVVPMMNPDGVDHGHWRHNAGGIDLNRDWQDLNQPETQAVDRIMRSRTEGTENKIYLCIDFHSTYEDIFYTIDPAHEGNMPGLVPALIEATGEGLENYVPNIRPRPADDAPVTSLAYFYQVYGAESLVYEIGDDTPRDFLEQKGRLSAVRMMEFMLDNLEQ